jgi:hypothetical protein
MFRKPDSEVQCLECGKRRKVNFNDCTFGGTGWPKCCGYTMTLMRSPHGGDEMIEGGRVYGLDADEERYAGIVDSDDSGGY